jgi:hypothetical protein
MNTRVILDLQGGLGNQLFQLAACQGILTKANLTLEIDITSIKNSRRQMELGFFKNILNWQEVQINIFTKMLAKRISEPEEFSYTLLHISKNRTNLVSGYFQHARYASQLLEILSQEAIKIRSKNNKLNICPCLAPHIALHVRRGDYESIAVNKEKFGVLADHYFNTVIESNAPDAHVVIFSDSLVAIPHEIEKNCRGEISLFDSTGLSPIETMIALSGYETIAISNSSFSWWAANIAQLIKPETKIISPSLWFRGYPSSNALVQKNWHMQEVDWV